MSNDSTITSNFLSAIQEYADRQKKQIEEELREFKQAELKKAEDESLEEAYRLIQGEVSQKRAAIRSELARKEQDSRAQLFKLRSEMIDKLFAGAKEKLIAFTETDEYEIKLLKSAQKLAALFKGAPCTLFVRECDLRFSDKISALFETKPQINADSSILIGGIKGKCHELLITADETLDTLLDIQRGNFIRTSTLKVV